MTYISLNSQGVKPYFILLHLPPVVGQVVENVFPIP